MAGGQLIFQPPKFDWHAEDQLLAFDKWKGQITLVLRASSINRDIWFAMIIGYLGKEGFKWWNTLPISTDEEAQKDLERVYKAIVDTLEVSTCHIGTISTRSILTSNKATMSQPTNLTRGSRILLKDANTQMRRNWYVEQNSYFMRPSILR